MIVIKIDKEKQVSIFALITKAAGSSILLTHGEIHGSVSMRDYLINQ